MKNDLPDFDLERYLPYRFTVLAARLSAGLAKQYKAKYGISIPEWRVLVNVGYAENLSVRDIEKRVSLEKSKVSRAASKLCSKGFLTKQIDVNDRRLVRFELTDQGVELLNNLIPIAQSYQSDLNRALGDQLDVMQRSLDRLMEEAE